MLNKRMFQKKHKRDPLKLKYTESLSGSQVSENFCTEAFYRHALTLRKAFGISGNSSSSPDLIRRNCVEEQNYNKRKSERNKILPNLKPQVSLKLRSSFSPYDSGDMRSSVVSINLMQSGSYDNKEAGKRIRRIRLDEGNAGKKQMKTVRNKVLPRLGKLDVKLVQSDQMDLLTGW